MTKIITIAKRVFFLALITLESWLLFVMMIFGYYLFVILLLIILFAIFLLSRMKALERKKHSFIEAFHNLENNYLKTKKSQQKAFAVIESFQDGVLILDEQNTIEYMNFQAEKMLDVSYKKMVNKPIFGLKAFPDLDPIISLLLREVKYSFKKELKVGANSALEVQVNLLPRMGKVVILHDISKERLFQGAKNDFVSLTAHQLSSPLSAAKLSLEMILDGSLGKITNKQKDIIKKTHQRITLLTSFVNDLLDIAKIDGGAYSCTFELVDVEDLIDSLISLNKQEIKNKKIKLTVKKPQTKIGKMIMDKEKIFVAVKNVFDNAVKYTPLKGKITFVYGLNQNKELEWSVEDSGMGIPASEKGKIFTKFFRGSNATRLDTMGSGLGLFIAKNIVEAHGGKIWFDSEEGKGSTFYIAIPNKEDALR